ncbi:MAG: 6-bladed beta-propeller [Nitrospirota bacterium]
MSVIKNMKSGFSRIMTVQVIFFSLVLSGCFQEAVKVTEPLPDIIWPKPHEVPRIRFVNSISGPQHLRISEGLLKRLFKYFTGRAEMLLVSPHGLAVDSEGRLYVIDTYLKKVHVFDVKRNNFYTFPEKGVSLTMPIDLAVDNKRGYIFVTDSAEASIKIFKNGGTENAGEIKRGAIGRPTGIAVNEKTDELLVVDTMNSNILRFDLNDNRLKGIIGSDGQAHGKFHYPTSIFVSKDGNILVSDSLNFRIQVFSSAGEFIRAFGEAGDSPGYFSRPKGVAADSDGNIYVVDALFDNVQIFDKNGRLLMAFGKPGNYYGEFWLPTGIFIDRDDNIYVSDTYNKRVQVFKYMKGDEFISP